VDAATNSEPERRIPARQMKRKGIYTDDIACVPRLRLICDLLLPISLYSHVFYSLYIKEEINCHIKEI
jgi:hypothetical protein